MDLGDDKTNRISEPGLWLVLRAVMVDWVGGNFDWFCKPEKEVSRVGEVAGCGKGPLAGFREQRVNLFVAVSDRYFAGTVDHRLTILGKCDC